MALVDVQKTLHSFTIDRESASQMKCSTIHSYMAKRITTPDAKIMLEPGQSTDKGKWIVGGLQVEVPNSGLTLSELLPEPHNECRIVAKYTVTEERSADPSEKLTRLEFVIQTLDAWESVLRNIESLGVRHSALGREVLTAMELLKDTYSYQELGTDVDTLRELLTIHKLEDIPASK